MMHPKPTRAKPDPAYLAEVRRLPCAICRTTVGVEAHHPAQGRYSQRRAPDRDAIPLCRADHDARHRHPAEWLARHGPEARLTAQTRETIAKLRAEMIGGRS
jgi:hypothetical protein